MANQPGVAVIIPAAGMSTRFGGAEKKPYVHLAGQPLWLRTCELFWNRPDVVQVYLVVAPADLDTFLERNQAILAASRVEVVAGGNERFESVANALARVPATVDLVAVHDAVRPLTTAELIAAVFARAAVHGAAMLAVPVADTLKRVDAATSLIRETVPRAGLWAAQTPQVFRRDWLVSAYASRAAIAMPITDDAQLVEALGHDVFVVPGSAQNFKITTKPDLELAEAILLLR